MRLAKYLASAGVASRRAAEQIIREGRVTVAGKPVSDPARDVQPGTPVTVDGITIAADPQRVVYALNKPSGVVSTASDPQGRPTVVSLLPRTNRLYPVGRLDIDTTGLILLTNDGELAHRLTHPSFEVEKTYRATVANPPLKSQALTRLRAGVELDDGKTAPAKIKRLAPDRLEVTIHEGRKRQIRRMCEAVGHPVTKLERIAIGGLRLGSLAPGAYRPLSEAETAALTAPAAGSAARRRRTSWS